MKEVDLSKYQKVNTIKLDYTNIKGIVIWNYDISLFTFSLFKYIPNDVMVIYAVENIYFRDQGLLDIGKAKYYHIKNHNDVVDLVNKTTSFLHFNNAFDNRWPKLIHYAMNVLMQKNIKVFALFQEQYPWNDGWKGFLRRFKWFYLMNLKYRKVVAIGCTGNSGITAYKKAMVPYKKLFELIYITPTINADLSYHNSKIEFIFIGQLVDRKSICELISIFNSSTLNEYDFHFTIIGDGILKERVQLDIKENNKISYYPNMPNVEVKKKLQHCDYLILPSKFDGWGCVVNEAFQSGIKVLCSDAVGAHSLIQNHPFLGKIYKNRNWFECESQIVKIINEGPLSFEMRNKIYNWSKNISSEIVYPYFVSAINYYLYNEGQKPSVPWK